MRLQVVIVTLPLKNGSRKPAADCRLRECVPRVSNMSRLLRREAQACNAVRCYALIRLPLCQ